MDGGNGCVDGFEDEVTGGHKVVAESGIDRACEQGCGLVGKRPQWVVMAWAAASVTDNMRALIFSTGTVLLYSAQGGPTCARYRGGRWRWPARG